jgi:hypothetical protein
MLLFIGPQRHSLRPYLDYVGFLFQRMDPLPEQERFEVNCFLLCFHTHTNTPHSKSFSLLDRDDYFLFFPCYFFFTALISYASLVTGISYSLRCRWTFPSQHLVLSHCLNILSQCIFAQSQVFALLFFLVASCIVLK